ncbi:MAG: MFS transporter, partial [Ignavibacteriae bacterium]|nr:MFS transporter [Ignavibacteriota bacterium]
LWMAIPFAFVGVLTFTVPDFGPDGKLIWAYTTFILIMVLYTAINIPYTALLGVISPDSLERTSVSQFKFLFAFAAGIIVSATLLPLVQLLGNGNDAQGWQYTFIIYGIAAVIFFFIAFKGTKERVQPPKNQKSSIKQDLFELVTNGPWLILLLTTILFILFVAVRSSVTVHYFKYYVGTQDVSLPFLEKGTYDFNAIVSVFNTVGQVSSFIGVLIISWITKLLGKKTTFVTLFIIAIIGTGGFYFCGPDQLGLIFFFQIIGSLSGGPLSVILWAMYADTADYAEWKFGRRATGIVFSAATFGQKFGWGIGGAITGWLLAMFNYEPNTIQSSETILGIKLMLSIIPGALMILSVILLFFYNLTEPMMEKVQSELADRRLVNE